MCAIIRYFFLILVKIRPLGGWKLKNFIKIFSKIIRNVKIRPLGG